MKGEDLKKLIGAPAYIECSSKTQQVLPQVTSFSCLSSLRRFSFLTLKYGLQNVKAVFDAAIKVVLQPPKQKKKKKKGQKACSIL